MKLEAISFLLITLLPLFSIADQCPQISKGVYAAEDGPTGKMQLIVRDIVDTLGAEAKAEWVQAGMIAADTKTFAFQEGSLVGVSTFVTIPTLKGSSAIMQLFLNDQLITSSGDIPQEERGLFMSHCQDGKRFNTMPDIEKVGARQTINTLQGYSIEAIDANSFTFRQVVFQREGKVFRLETPDASAPAVIFNKTESIE